MKQKPYYTFYYWGAFFLDSLYHRYCIYMYMMYFYLQIGQSCPLQKEMTTKTFQRRIMIQKNYSWPMMNTLLNMVCFITSKCTNIKEVQSTWDSQFDTGPIHGMSILSLTKLVLVFSSYFVIQHQIFYLKSFCG